MFLRRVAPVPWRAQDGRGGAHRPPARARHDRARGGGGGEGGRAARPQRLQGAALARARGGAPAGDRRELSGPLGADAIIAPLGGNAGRERSGQIGGKTRPRPGRGRARGRGQRPRARRLRPQRAERRSVAATVFPIYDLARRVAGDRLDVRLILAPGLDPHGYEPRPTRRGRARRREPHLRGGPRARPVGPGARAQRGRGRGAGLRARPAHGPDPRPPGGRPHGAAHRPALLDRPRARASTRWTSSSRRSPASTPPAGPSTASAARRSKRSIAGACNAEVARAGARPGRRRRIVTFHGSLFYFAARYGLQVVGVVRAGAGPGADRAAHGRAGRPAEGARRAPRSSRSRRWTRSSPAPSRARRASCVHQVDPIGGGPQAASYEDMVRGIAQAHGRGPAMSDALARARRRRVEARRPARPRRRHLRGRPGRVRVPVRARTAAARRRFLKAALGLVPLAAGSIEVLGATRRGAAAARRLPAAGQGLQPGLPRAGGRGDRGEPARARGRCA